MRTTFPTGVLLGFLHLVVDVEILMNPCVFDRVCICGVQEVSIRLSCFKQSRTVSISLGHWGVGAIKVHSSVGVEISCLLILNASEFSSGSPVYTHARTQSHS